MSNTEPIVMRIIAEDETGPAFDSASRTQRRNEQQVKRLVAKYEELKDTVNMSADEIELHRAKLAGASNEQLKFIKDTQAFVQAEKNKKTALEQANGSLRLMRGGLGQVGHQLQDVVVQAQMGTNGFLILGQQGSQVASLFGSKGALFGAVLALGAAFATFIQASNKASNSLKELEQSGDKIAEMFGNKVADGVSRASEELRELAARSKELALTKILVNQIQAQQNLTDAQRLFNKELNLTQTNTTGTAVALKTTDKSLSTLNRQYEIGSENTAEFLRLGKLLKQDLVANAGAFMTFARTVIESGKGNKKFSDLVENVATFEQQAFQATQQLQMLNALSQELETGGFGPTQDELDDQARAQEIVSEAYFKQMGQLDQLRAKHKENQKVVLDAMAKTGASLEEQVAMGIMLQQQYRAEVRRVHDERLAQFEALDDARQKEADKAAKAAAKEQEDIQRRGAAIQLVAAGEISAIAKINAMYDKKLNQVKNLYSQEPQLAQIAAAEVIQIEAERTAAIKAHNDKQLALRAEAKSKIEDMMDDGTNKFMNDLAKRQAALEQARAENIINETEFSNYQKQLQTEYANHVLNEQLRIVGGLKHVEDSFVNASHAFITGAQNGTEAIRQFGRAIVDELIKSLIQMGIEQVKQMIIKKKVEATALTQSVAANATAMTAIAAQAAPAAAAVSLATSGGNSVGAINGLIATHGVSRALSANSFEGGGFTGFGSRSGGIDGRGGFLATLHPNETVVDHSRGGGAGVTIINNIDASGSGDVDQRIAAAVTQASQQTVEQVHNMMRRGRM